MATGYEPMTDEELEEIDEWLHDGEGVSFEQQVRLADDVERQRAVIAEQQAQLAAMRPIVAAVAEHIGGYVSEHFRQCAFCANGAIESRVIAHADDCEVTQARAYLAAHQSQP